MSNLYPIPQILYSGKTQPLFVGIDPGKTGALAVLDEKGQYIHLIDYNRRDILSYLYASPDGKICHAYLEHVHSMPNQGVSSTFCFGENFGWWQGVLESLAIPYGLITPQAWQKKFCLQKDCKTDKPSLVLARKIFPQADLHLKKHHNRSDALLIAKACWEDFHGEKGANIYERQESE